MFLYFLEYTAHNFSKQDNGADWVLILSAAAERCITNPLKMNHQILMVGSGRHYSLSLNRLSIPSPFMLREPGFYS